jgi:PAS domain S-box-containing protein
MSLLNQIPCESIMNSIADGVFTVDMDFNITFFNRSAERITGVGSLEAMGRKCWEVFHSSICDGSCALKECLQSDRNLGNKSIYILRPDGAKVSVSISASPLRDHDGRIVGGVETFRDITAIQLMRQRLEGLYTQDDIVTKSQSVYRILQILPQIAGSDASVLLLGESGTGKELFARAIHNQSARKSGPFVAVNCGALPENLLESELFGYKAGAFTDAKADKPGRFSLAKDGTIFLDEIGDLPLKLQVKILRVLQEKNYEPLGSVKSVPTNARVITATNRDLSSMVAAGAFRDDLFYRLNVVQLRLPPLRERPEDIPLLISHFIARGNAVKGKDIQGVSEDVYQLLMRHPFPGNVRELENIIEYAFILCQKGFIQIEHLPEYFLPKDKESCPPCKPLDGNIKNIKYQAVLDALRRHGGKKMAACRELGISKDTLRRIMRSGSGAK